MNVASENDVMAQFLGPETDIMGKRYFINVLKVTLIKFLDCNSFLASNQNT